ncbi:putative membrane protein [Spirosoma lacussanchae]|uniref:hypothetical protein n=1 Tax=Spirosoma lacussanchae TaxID=1884249 RepID=UPI00110972CE|nr:hypothetical protein [Spirosoma lacussanchae]
MIKAVLSFPVLLLVGLVLAFWLLVAIGSVVLLAFCLSPILSLFDEFFNAQSVPSKYAHYDA